MLGHREDARRYADVAKKVYAAFNQRFLELATGIYGHPGATAQIGYPIPPVGGRIGMGCNLLSISLKPMLLQKFGQA
jgi:hypothetical protein